MTVMLVVLVLVLVLVISFLDGDLLDDHDDNGPGLLIDDARWFEATEGLDSSHGLGRGVAESPSLALGVLDLESGRGEGVVEPRNVVALHRLVQVPSGIHRCPLVYQVRLT